jgi:TonB family protein
MHPRSPPPARSERPGVRAAAALLLSLLVNGGALLALEGAGAFRLPRPERATAVVLARVEAADWEARRRVAAPSVPAALQAPARPAPETAEVPAGQLVRVAPSQDPRRPESARFLAERDNTVARETQWRGAPVRNAPLAARPTAGAAEGQGIPLPGEEGKAETSSPGREGTAAPDAATRIARARLALTQAPDEITAGADPGKAPATAGEGGLRRTGRFDPRILPVGEAFGAPGRGAPSGERLPGVADGDATLVNTRAFRFAAFYQRVAEAIRGEWDPNRVWDARDPQDQLLGRQARKVLVDIVLDPEGRLRETRLVRGTGLDFFDRECLRAISAAAPFPNPPRALVGADGLVVLRDWGLVFEWGPDALLDRLLPGR